MAGGEDIFALGRAAVEATLGAHGGRGWFACGRRLRADGTWQGAAGAGNAWVEECDLEAVGGLAGARALGANLFLGNSLPVTGQAASHGMRGILRLPVLPDETPEDQTRRLRQLRESRATLDGVAPTPAEDGLGLATLTLVARARLLLPAGIHILVDLSRLGPKLGQLALGFGADELFGPIVVERPLRLGDHAGSRDITRQEAAQLLRGAGLRAFERVGQEEPREFLP